MTKHTNIGGSKKSSRAWKPKYSGRQQQSKIHAVTNTLRGERQVSMTRGDTNLPQLALPNERRTR
jgi:hypothetical protein